MFRTAEAAYKRNFAGCFAQAPTVRRALACVLTLLGLVSASDALFAQSVPKKEPLKFSIPSQPLESALARYGDVTGSEALYDTSLAAGRVSGEIEGLFTFREALDRLLSGTGLSARFVSESSFVLLPAPPAVRPTAQRAPAHVLQRYYGLIQETLLDALCRTRGARPGRYRIVAVFWIGKTGAVEKSERLGTAGDAETDQQIDATLRRVKLSEPPPAGFEQPVLILLVPQAPGVKPGCTSADLLLHRSGILP